MEVSPFVSLKYVSEFLEGEIKQISERWGQFMINKIALERVLITQKPTKEDLVTYGYIEESLKGRKPQDHPRYLKTLPEEQKKSYERVKEYKEQEASLETAEKGLKEFCDFLEVATGLKKDIDLKISQNSTSDKEIKYV